ncbi:MAG: hypothetical protein M5U01_28990 [Ardenticatenaceae bacterium]|nr:hypothetical protein [Ardenticatenaceae bacterium]HBY97313.1 hypothetical protein [Chloroflexota bacterium]
MNKSPVTVEVISLILSSFNHCKHCQVFIDGVGVGGQVHQSDIDSYPEPLKEEYNRLYAVVREMADKHAGRVLFKITDAQSIPGLWKQIRYGIRRYPAFIVDGREKIVGWDLEGLEAAIQNQLAIN